MLSLAADAARALLYLHHVTKPAVVHRDVKPANFLLDRAWRMKLADFGLAANSSKQVMFTAAALWMEGLHWAFVVQRCMLYRTWLRCCSMVRTARSCMGGEG